MMGGRKFITTLHIKRVDYIEPLNFLSFFLKFWLIQIKMIENKVRHIACFPSITERHGCQMWRRLINRVDHSELENASGSESFFIQRKSDFRIRRLCFLCVYIYIFHIPYMEYRTEVKRVGGGGSYRCRSLWSRSSSPDWLKFVCLFGTEYGEGHFDLWSDLMRGWRGWWVWGNWKEVKKSLWKVCGAESQTHKG